ncbi:hypothetical protein PENARI_c003G02973 [Penicillium arizonense]|uniref:Uncharacterized protein n=1 Tax=Penicillium arizonense TaxID=1835702 RepID=A0A1F5LT93_PENAI|nr:hypothetical protein PENARI_c003G02973 [Penicillium arizonense]OGE56418.1 hypothetical protein PENARI_c003G02973 [Penicillium arizonense]
MAPREPAEMARSTQRGMFIQDGHFVREDIHNMQTAQPIYWVTVFIRGRTGTDDKLMKQVVRLIEQRQCLVTTEPLHATYKSCISLPVTGEWDSVIAVQHAESYARMLLLEIQCDTLFINWDYFHEGVTTDEHPVKDNIVVRLPAIPHYRREA